MLVVAADPGFSFADPYAVAIAFAGVAVFAAVGALSHQHERAFSASVIYLVLGLVAATAIDVVGVSWIEPVSDAKLLERLSELAVVVALFATGLKLERAFDKRLWASMTRLMVVVMPLTIAAVTLFGTAVMGLSLGAAIILGAALAPTDPVLAGDVGIGPPGEEDEHESNVALTTEAGLNDALAYPFVLLGAFIAAEGGSGWIGEWLSADVLYSVAVATAIGAAAGYGIAAGIVSLRDGELLAPALDGWVAVGAALLVYGATEVGGGYGFLAVFFAGVAFRRYEHGHELNRRVHDGAEVVEKFSELGLILVLGSVVTIGGLAEAGVSGLLLVPLLLLVIRPLATVIGFLGSHMPPKERLFIGWFGIRGIGSLYYVAVAIGLGVLPKDDARTLFWTVAFCIVVSIVVHGVTAAPFARRLLPR